MKNLKNQKGITLVALVVTIIVLLILAGVSLRLVAGNEGILGRSEDAVNKNNIAAVREQAELALTNFKMAFLEEKYDSAITSKTPDFATYVKNNLDDVNNDIKEGLLVEETDNVYKLKLGKESATATETGYTVTITVDTVTWDKK